jgi:hypothetical protein
VTYSNCRFPLKAGWGQKLGSRKATAAAAATATETITATATATATAIGTVELCRQLRDSTRESYARTTRTHLFTNHCLSFATSLHPSNSLTFSLSLSLSRSPSLSLVALPLCSSIVTDRFFVSAFQYTGAQ